MDEQILFSFLFSDLGYFKCKVTTVHVIALEVRETEWELSTSLLSIQVNVY